MKLAINKRCSKAGQVATLTAKEEVFFVSSFNFCFEQRVIARMCNQTEQISGGC